ncbi:MAG TPA: hypothetical protein VMG09_15460 [Bacteroidota bacterium]|nr:hypothetical protein [Bacteroidota bacterium]
MLTSTPIANAVYFSLRRQIVHWKQAALRLAALDQLASGYAWHGIEQHVGEIIRTTLRTSVDRILAHANMVFAEMENASDAASLWRLQRDVIQLREQYLRAEETIHFYTAAVNSRTTASVAALLRACDILCHKSMQEALQPLDRPSPRVLTYIDIGVGASILKAGLHLWDGNVNSIAVIKVTYHNLFRPTSIIHESGHQVAHILGWNDELARGLATGLSGHPEAVGRAAAGWASEIAADAFAFVHTGYAAVAALHDVVSGSPLSVFAYRPDDPHPVSYVRVLLGIEMCRQFFGDGPWDQLETAFKSDYDIRLVTFPSVDLINMCVKALPDMVRIILQSPYGAFRGRPLSHLIDPGRVSPRGLEKLEYLAGPSLYTSHAWVWKECLKLLALDGYKIALGRGDLAVLYKQEEDWMTRLGFAVELN